MFQRAFGGLLAASVAVVAGCASVSARPVVPGDERSPSGIPLYSSLPWLLIEEVPTPREDDKLGPTGTKSPVGSANQGTPSSQATVDTTGNAGDKVDPAQGKGADRRFKVSIIYLPDPCGQYRLRARAFLSKVNFKADIYDGWRLTTVDAALESQEVPAKVLGTLADVLAGKTTAGASLVGGASGRPEDTSPGGFQLYPLFEREDGSCKKPLQLSTAAEKLMAQE